MQARALCEAGHPSALVLPLTTSLVDDAEPLRIRVLASGRLPESLLAKVGEAIVEVLDLPRA